MGLSDYTVLRKIGEGAFGKVFVVQHKATSKQYVMKSLDLGQNVDKDEALKEVKVMKEMKHPNIVGYKECFEDLPLNLLNFAVQQPNGRNKAKHFYIVMTYADGGDLESKIKSRRNNSLPEQQIFDWFIQICLALKHMHDRKILHRDIKSQNIFLTIQNTIKLGDFGIARLLDHTMQKAMTQIGTPYYLSPEICHGRPYDAKSDVWSLGVVLYEMMCLSHPFQGNNMKDLIDKIVKAPLKPLPGKYSAGLTGICKEMLSKDPSKRPTINDILSRTFIKRHINKFLSLHQLEEEFSHTVLHYNGKRRNCMDPSWKEPPNAANPGNAESKNTPSAESKNAVNRPPSVKPPLSVAPKASPSPMPFLFPAPPAALSALPQQHQVQPASVAVKATKSPSEDNSLQNLLQKAEKELRALRVQKCKIMNKPLAGYRMQQQQQQQQQQQPQPPQQPQQQQQLPQPVSAKPIIKPRQPWIDLVPQNNGASPSPSEPPGSNKPKESKAAAAPVRTPSVEDLIQIQLKQNREAAILNRRRAENDYRSQEPSVPSSAPSVPVPAVVQPSGVRQQSSESSSPPRSYEAELAKIRQEFFLEKQAIVEKLKEDQYIARVQSNAKSVRFEVGAIDEPQDSSSKPSNPANKRGGAGFDEDQWTKARQDYAAERKALEAKMKALHQADIYGPPASVDKAAVAVEDYEQPVMESDAEASPLSHSHSEAVIQELDEEEQENAREFIEMIQSMRGLIENDDDPSPSSPVPKDDTADSKDEADDNNDEDELDMSLLDDSDDQSDDFQVHSVREFTELGCTMKVANIQSSDSLSYKVESLRVTLAETLGEELLIKIVRQNQIQPLSGSKSVHEICMELMPESVHLYIGMVQMLIEAENRLYGS